ncbi:DUF2029 domain-containing protein [Nocardia huaxiensis]|uniref:DUF2029 domain-containing protein n=1 Tax=Nocardia huaxiensis TaxID=2755382 RepID=A0A7D6V5W1_9NOCA|nr:glycosyltransferase 87 family protein [Nocardia huaxiensis]QLY28201.1 DUF2029 domain-containing protein [Nocardia huaxiensis]
MVTALGAVAAPELKREPVVANAVLVVSGLLACAVVGWHIFAIPIGTPYYGLFNNHVDLTVYRAGGEAIAHRAGLYDGAVVFGMQFTYTPFAALVFVPLTWVGLHTANLLWWTAIFAALVAIVAVSLRSLGYRATPRTALFAFFLAVASTALEPVRTTIWLGQVNVFIVLLVLWDLTRPNSKGRGIGVGIAAGIKLTPILFLAYLAVTRQWRTCATAAATLAGTVALGFVIIPGDAWGYWANQFTNSSRIGAVDSPGNQSINGAIAQLLRLFHVDRYLHTGPGLYLYVPPTWLWLAVAVPIAVGGLAAGALAYRRGQQVLAISVVGMTSAAVSPFAWGHHWVWFVPLLVVLLHHALDDRSWWSGLAAGALAAVAFCWWWSFTDREPLEGAPYPIGLGLFMMPRDDPAWWSNIVVPFYAVCFPLVLLVTIGFILFHSHGSE